MDTKNLNIEIIRDDGFSNFMSYMPDPDTFLMDVGDTFEAYRSMKKDGKISSLLKLRKVGVLSFPWRIEQGNAPDNVHAFVREKLTERLNWDRDIQELLSAIEYGYAVSEVIWAKQGRYWVPDALMARRADRFRFRADWTPVLANGMKPITVPYKLLVYRNDPENESPYGTAELARCYWPHSFKQAGFEFWMRAVEKFSVPSVLALFDSTDERQARERSQSIATSLERVRSGSGAGLANVKSVHALELKGGLKDFQVLINTCNSEISFALTGQSLATQEAEHGTRAQAEVHNRTLIEICRGDAKGLTGTLQELINWMVEINFGTGVPAPKGGFDLRNYASFEEVTRAIEIGVPVSRSLLYDRYGLPRPKDEEDQMRALHPSGTIELADTAPSAGKKKLKIT